MTRQEEERAHYTRRASASDADGPSGADSVELPLRAPYLHYEQVIRTAVAGRDVSLEIGTGTGAMSAPMLGANLFVGTDIALAPLLIARERLAKYSGNCSFVVCDAEQLPFQPGSVDVVGSAGVLYCLAHARVAEQVARVLHAHGKWVIVDSLKHAPWYRMNRVFGFMRGTRTRAALYNIPGIETFTSLRMSFSTVAIRPFGVLAFLVPILRLLFNERKVAALVEAGDRLFRQFGRLSFKVVVVATHPIDPASPEAPE